MTVAGLGPSANFRRLLVLIAVNFVDMIGFMIVLPLLPFYALRLHASPETVGQLIASFSIAQLLAAPVWGRVSDRYGRRPALLIGLSASAIAYVVFSFADSVWLLLASRLVQGAGGAQGPSPGSRLALRRNLRRRHPGACPRILRLPLRPPGAGTPRRRSLSAERGLRVEVAS
jgi:MFS family permease